jgi:hypothetical protein
MFLITEADAEAIRAIFSQEDELSAAIELRRRFPGITDNAMARGARPDHRRMEAAAVTTALGNPAAPSRLRAGANSIRRPRPRPGDRTRQLKPQSEAHAVARRGRVSLWRHV